MTKTGQRTDPSAKFSLCCCVDNMTGRSPQQTTKYNAWLIHHSHHESYIDITGAAGETSTAGGYG